MSQLLYSPCDNHWNFVFRNLRYIKGSDRRVLIYKNSGHAYIVAYTNADWQRFPGDSRSTSGYYVLTSGNLVSWKSKRQNIVAMSSAEVVWLKQLL